MRMRGRMRDRTIDRQLGVEPANEIQWTTAKG
jgi:hypothetical protein